MQFNATTLLHTSLVALPLAFGAVNFTSESARAVVIGGNGGPDFVNALVSNLNPDGLLFDNFQLNQGISTVTDLHWWGTDAPANGFTVEIFNDSSGEPGNTSFPATFNGSVSKTQVGSIGGVPIFNYSVDIQPINLALSTPYWLTIYNTQPAWGWATHNQAAGGHLRLAEDAMGNFGFQPEQGNLAFEVTGVPEPLTLGGVALAGVFGAAFKRKLNKSGGENVNKS